MNETNIIYGFIITPNQQFPPQGQGIVLISALTEGQALDFVNNVIKQNNPNVPFSTNLCFKQTIEQHIKNLNLSIQTIQFAPLPEEKSEVVNEVKVEKPPDYEKLAKLLRDNGYRVTKKKV